MKRTLILLCALLQTASRAGQPGGVALDIGHSLEAPGARSASGQTEFSLNRAMALSIAQQLTPLGLKPQLIGAQGEITQLRQRTRQAAGRQWLISIHHDSIQPRYLPQAQQFRGYSLFISRKNPQAQASLACARLIAHALQAIGEQPSSHHAETIAGENRPWADARLGIYWYDNLVVLKTAQQPAILIEIGVIVNPLEEKRLEIPAVHQAQATAIAQGIRQCQDMPSAATLW